ncbi:hypothetical protein DFH08DRAFT_821931 [Mycena albidolilacea]|uniref:DUF6533 domain-containing protein n=1 Tax=Mycena albidolilacea TaxID=1033008 RepID=A0AAD7EDQ2_9AGAR|nr:hypothetical protein DFH08DRAFT_821931 [Mycena albidolilacea]
MAALLYYDFVLMLPKEIQYIWNQRFRLSTALYIGCRYALLANVLYLLAIEDKLGSTVRLVVQNNRRYEWIIAYMVILGLACIVLGITHVPGLHCMGSSTLPIISPAYAISSDSHFRILVGVPDDLTMCKGHPRRGRGKVVAFLLYGAIPDANICPLGVVYFWSLFREICIHRTEYGTHLSLHRLSCILTARCILHLREWYAVQLRGSSRSRRTTNGSLVFRASASWRSSVHIGAALASIVAVDDFGADPVAVAHAEVQMRTEVQLSVAGPSGCKDRNIDINGGTRSACLEENAPKGAIERDGTATESEIEPV